jgi:hypothetical protein
MGWQGTGTYTQAFCCLHLTNSEPLGGPKSSLNHPRPDRHVTDASKPQKGLDVLDRFCATYTGHHKALKIVRY